MIDIIDASPRIPSHLPTGGQRLRSFPRRATSVVVHVISPVILVHSHFPAVLAMANTKGNKKMNKNKREINLTKKDIIFF